MDKIILKGLSQNNLKHITLEIPKKKIVVFTGVSGSGKSSIVFDTIAAESGRQMNQTYPAFVRNRLPKHVKPDCDRIENLSPSVVIDQTPLGSNARSTVGTSSQIYSGLRLLFSRIGEPYAGPASLFSFNDPNGMCQECSGLGMVTDIDLGQILDMEKSLNEGAFTDSTIKVGSWYWKQYVNSGLFDPNKPLKEYSEKELNLLLYGNSQGRTAEADGGSQEKNGEKGLSESTQSEKAHSKEKKLPGIFHLYRKRYLTRDVPKAMQEKAERIVTQKLCPCCRGKRLNRKALACWIQGYSIGDLCDMELTELQGVLQSISDERVKEIRDNLVSAVGRMIDIGLGYLSLSRTTQSLSGGEAQRVKLVRYLGSSLSDMLYIFDEPSTGMHPRDVYRMNKLLIELRDKGNTVLVVEHDDDVISIADEVVDVGPLAGVGGGTIVFQGPYDQLLQSESITGKALRERKKLPLEFRTPTGFLPIRKACLHNLKNCDADIPTGVICVITGVAGSGKSSLMTVFSEKYQDKVVKLDQKPIMATNRSTPASYLGIMDEIRKEFAALNQVDEGWFSFNSIGACPHCKGKGVIVTELAYMDPVVTTCEACNGSRYSDEALSYQYKGKNILEVLSMTAKEAELFFENKKILKGISALNQVGLSYMTLGQPLSTLSGGERQRIKLATKLGKKGNIYLLDEPTTGLHPSDIEKLMGLFESLVKKGNSVIIIEHNLEVMKMADYIIDIGPDGGKNGGEVVFAGTPREMVETAQTITAKCLRMMECGRRFTQEELASLVETTTTQKEEDEMARMMLQPIGRVENEYGEFRIVLDQRFAAALEGLEGFSHVQVVWWFDGCDNEHDRKVLSNEKPYTNGPTQIGTFATRSPQRPNPIGLSVAEIKEIQLEKGVIVLTYIDADMGTPVLDIKPYIPSADKVDAVEVPTWCKHWPNCWEDSGDFDWEKEFNV